MQSFKKITPYLMLPGLTILTCVCSLIVLITSWNSSCDNYSNTIAQVWLLVYTICCIPGAVLAFFGASAYTLKGQHNGPAGGVMLVLFWIFLLGTFIWNIVGYIMLFGYFRCFDNPLAIIMLIDIIYQSGCLLYSLVQSFSLLC